MINFDLQYMKLPVEQKLKRIKEFYSAIAHLDKIRNPNLTKLVKDDEARVSLLITVINESFASKKTITEALQVYENA